MDEYREMLKQAIGSTASANAIALARGMSHHTIRRARTIANAHGLAAADVDRLSNTELKHIFQAGRAKPEKIYPDYADEEAFLAKGYNLAEGHKRYTDRVGEAAICYSAYCQRIREYRQQQEPVYRHVHVAGYAIQTDFAGYRPTGLEDGKSRRFELFVAVLPLSHLMFAICTRTQSTTDHIEANIAALEFFGGSTETIRSDNLKAVVISRKHGAPPLINPAFLAFADYYGMRVDPARVRRPKDKASVEIAVKLIQRLLRIALMNQPALTLPEINLRLRDLVCRYNQRPMKRGSENREQRFARLEQQALQPLPKERLQFLEAPVSRRVSPDHHISFERVHYSVPHKLIGKNVLVRASSRIVEIRYDGLLVAVHPRSYADDTYVTVDAHRPEGHRIYLDRSFEDWRATLHPLVNALVAAAILEARQTERERLAIRDRVRKLIRLYTHQRLIAAVEKAQRMDALTLRHVTKMLQNNIEGSPDPSTHSRMAKLNTENNVRGATYFDRDIDGREDAA